MQFYLMMKRDDSMIASVRREAARADPATQTHTFRPISHLKISLICSSEADSLQVSVCVCVWESLCITACVKIVWMVKSRSS